MKLAGFLTKKELRGTYNGWQYVDGVKTGAFLVGSCWGQKQGDPHLKTLRKLLPQLDLLVVYQEGSCKATKKELRRTVRIATRMNHKKVVILQCSCQEFEKQSEIASLGLSDARVVWTRCGGVGAMLYLLAEFIRTGEFPHEIPRGDYGFL